jgi:protein-disulfide isomerase
MSDDEKSDSDREAPARGATPGAIKRKKAKGAVAAADPPPAVSAPKAAPASSPIALYVAAALVAGGAAGWFGRGAAGPESGATVASKVPPTAGSADPAAAAAAADVPASCTAWKDAVCEGAGADSEGCRSATSAARLLPAAACDSAMPAVGETVGKLAAARGACDELVKRLCGDLGAETETCKMVTEKTKSFPTEQCTGMMGEYPQVLAELKKMEAQNGPVPADVFARQIAGDAPGFGKADAKVTVVVYSDFECPFCVKAMATEKALKEKFGDKIRLVFRQFPLSFHPNAKLAAEASLAAHAQGKFWEFHEKLFENHRELERDSLVKYAKEVGLDVARFEKELDDSKHEARVDADMKLAEEVGVSGTPTMLVNARRVGNPTDVDAVSKMIEEELAK